MHTDTSHAYIPTDPDDVSIPLSGWFDILIHPRSAAARIAYMYGGPTAPAIVALNGVTTSLWTWTVLRILMQTEYGMSMAGAYATELGIIVPALIIGGLVSLYISGGILTLIGKWLGGSGSYGDVVLALALSTIPVTLGATLMAAISWLALRFGGNGPGLLSGVFWVSLAGFMAAMLYRYVVLIFGLSGVHRYSAWRALATLLVMWAIYLALDMARLLIGSLIS